MGPRSHDPAQTAAWLEKFLSRVMATQKTAAIDFGGGDVSLASLLRQVPDLQVMMERSGVEPVALYLLSPRVSDLTPLAAMEAAGFRPKATALILNMGRIQDERDPEQEFYQLRKHSAYRAAVERGAMQIWMPRLYAAKAVEERRAGFRQAARLDADAAPLAQPLDAFNQSRVRQWLEQMTAAFAPVESWLA